MSFKPRWDTLQWRGATPQVSGFIRYCRIGFNGDPSITHVVGEPARVEIWQRTDGGYDFDTPDKSLRGLSPVEIQCLLMEMWP